MKKTVLKGTTVLVVTAGILTGCSDDPSPYGGVSGTVVPTVSLDTRVQSSDRTGAMKAPASRATSEAMEVSLDDLTLTLTPIDGSAPFTCKGVSAFPLDKEFKVGEYTFEVAYGDAEAEGFELPAYYGQETVVVEENRTSSVSVTAGLVNSMVSIEFGEGLTSYATDLSAHLQTTGDKIAFSTSETRAAYVHPGTATVSVTLTKPNGVSGTVTIPAFTAKAKYHHHVKLDLTGGSSEALLNVTFDDTVETEDVEIELSDELLNSPAPTAVAQGFTSGEAVSFVAGLELDKTLTVDIAAHASIASVVMNTRSASLMAQGWPENIDLVKASAEEQAKLKSMGLDVLGLFKNPGRMAVVNFTKVASHIAYVNGGDNTTEISLTVIDCASKSAEPIVLALDAEALELGLTAITTQYPEAAGMPIELSLDFNGSNPATELAFQYKNERGTWAPLEVVSIDAMSRATNQYKVVVKAPAIDFSVEIRAVCGALSAMSESVMVKQVPFRLLASEDVTYAHSTMLTVVSTTLDATAVAKSGVLKLTPEATGISVKVEGAVLKIDGLASATTYKATLSYDGDECQAAVFTTETEQQVTDAGFDTWKGEQRGDYQWNWTVGDGSTWSTLNDLTTSSYGQGSSNGTNCKGAAYKATSGTIPANGRSTKTGDGGGTWGTSKSADGHTTGVSNLHSDLAYAGANAALIRTVGWGSGTPAPSTFTPKGSCDNITAGELYLGSYTEGADKEGIAFASRPAEVVFMYHYDPVQSGNGDFGTAEAKLYDASGAEIAHGAVELHEQSSWTEGKVALTYTVTNKKAARLSIVFKSSGNPSALVNDDSRMHRPGRNNISGGEYFGSELYIDNVELKY
ncbi:MAG: DUF4493 domain-containing protein [Muribaculaceae bacterium]|nr:DUF4493 domain-containing protein [Muribaculaceae bacterium]